jgi:hypothetical protein
MQGRSIVLFNDLQDGAVNRGTKANREVTRRCKSSGGLGGRNPYVSHGGYSGAIVLYSNISGFQFRDIMVAGSCAQRIPHEIDPISGIYNGISNKGGTG